jgi:hypothetical protein
VYPGWAYSFVWRSWSSLGYARTLKRESGTVDGTAEIWSLSFQVFGKNTRLSLIMEPTSDLSGLAGHSDWSDLERALHSRAAIGAVDRFRADFVADFGTHASISAVAYK